MSKVNKLGRQSTTNSKSLPGLKTMRLNVRAVIILTVLALVMIPGFFVLKAYHTQANQPIHLAEAKKSFEEKHFPEGLRQVNVYLKDNPNDITALEIKGKLLIQLARDNAGLEEAIKVQNQILSIDATRQEARKRLIELNLRAGQYRAAQVAAEAYVKVVDDAESHRMLGAAFAGVGRLGDPVGLDRAIEEFEIAERMQPGDIQGGLALAKLYRSKGKNPLRAQQLMDSLLKNNPKSPQVRLARFEYFSQDPDAPDRYTRAMSEIAETIKLDPGNAAARIISAEHAAQRGETVEARAHIAAINPMPANDLRIKFVQGLIELNEQHDEAAIENWRSGLIQTGGSDLELTENLARLLLSRGRIRDADPLLAQYRRLSGGTEPTPGYRFLQAIKFTKTGRADEAIKELESIRDKIDRSWTGRLLFALGNAYEIVKDEPKALDSYEKATRTADAGAPPWLAISRIQLASQPLDAVATLERGLASLPNEPVLLAGLAQLLWQQEASKPQDRRNWGDFERWLERAEKASPRSPEVTIVRADFLAANGRLDEGLKLIQNASDRSPFSVSLWLSRVNLLARLRRTDEAIAVLDKAVKAAGDLAPFRTSRARLLLERGETKAARDVLTTALDRVPREQVNQIWQALGEFHQDQRDYVASRRAYEEWAKVQPDSAAPRLALLGLAVITNDVAQMEAQVDAMKLIGGPTSLMWKIARGELLLQIKPTDPEYRAPQDKTRLAELEGLVKDIKISAPRQPSGYMLDGRLLEKRNRIDDAIAAYQQALDLRGGQVALRPLVGLLARENRNEELEALHKKVGSFPTELGKLATALTLQRGNAPEAERLANLMVQGDPKSLDAALWKARVLNSLGKPREAEETIKIFIQQKPEDPSPWLQLLMFQVARKEFPAARGTLESMKRKVKTERPELLWSTCYRVLGARNLADESLATALQKWPDDVMVRKAAVDYFESTGRLELAEQSLRHALKVTPGLDWARRRLAMILSARPNDQAAWSEALSLVNENTTGAETPDDRLHRAIVLARGSDPRNRDEAIRVLELLASEIPNSAKLHEVLARSLLSIGQKEKAIEHAALAAGNAEEASADSILLYASLCLDDKKFDEAERQLNRLIAIDSKALPTIELSARIFHAKGDDTKTVAELRRAFEEYKTAANNLVVGIGILRIFADLKLFDAGEAFGRDLAALGPKGQIAYAEYLAGRGKAAEARTLLEAAFKAGALADAVRSSLALASESANPGDWLEQTDSLLSIALKGQPESVDLLQSLAYLRHLQGNYTDEIRLYQEILNRNPGNFLFMNNMAWTLSEEMKKPQDGLDRINEALKKVGMQSHLLDTRGVIMLRLDKVPEAIKDLELAVTGLPTPPVFYHLARAYQKAGRTADFEKYRDLARKANLKPEQLQVSERDDAAKLIGFAKPTTTTKPTTSTPRP